MRSPGQRSPVRVRGVVAILRYAGGKKYVRADLMRFFPPGVVEDYREPFFGGGWVGLEWIRRRGDAGGDVWVNDADPAVAAFWETVRDAPDALVELVMLHAPHPDTYRVSLDRLGGARGPVLAVTDKLATAFDLLVLQKQSRGGFGRMAGSPIGGWKQTGRYPIDCRWTPGAIRRDILEASAALRGVKITAGDFAPLLGGSGGFVYCDPPYFVTGDRLYSVVMSQADHERLRDALLACGHGWVLSYNDHPSVREMYRQAEIHTIRVRPGGESRNVVRELIIVPNRAPAGDA